MEVYPKRTEKNKRKEPLGILFFYYFLLILLLISSKQIHYNDPHIFSSIILLISMMIMLINKIHKIEKQILSFKFTFLAMIFGTILANLIFYLKNLLRFF